MSDYYHDSCYYDSDEQKYMGDHYYDSDEQEWVDQDDLSIFDEEEEQE